MSKSDAINTKNHNDIDDDVTQEAATARVALADSAEVQIPGGMYFDGFTYRKAKPEELKHDPKSGNAASIGAEGSQLSDDAGTGGARRTRATT